MKGIAQLAQPEEDTDTVHVSVESDSHKIDLARLDADEQAEVRKVMDEPADKAAGAKDDLRQGCPHTLAEAMCLALNCILCFFWRGGGGGAKSLSPIGSHWRALALRR